MSKVERVVLNALAKTLRPCRLIFAPSAISSPIVFGEADPPLARNGGTVAAATPQRVGNEIAALPPNYLRLRRFYLASVRAGLAFSEKSIHLRQPRRGV